MASAVPAVRVALAAVPTLRGHGFAELSAKRWLLIRIDKLNHAHSKQWAWHPENGPMHCSLMSSTWVV
jgi:hypothetical protein